MTAIAAMQASKFALVVTDKLGMFGDNNESNVQKVFYGTDYIIGFAGTITSSFYNFIQSNIEAIALNATTSLDMIASIKDYLVANEPKYVKAVSCLCIKNGIMAYAKYSLDGYILTPKTNDFIGIGSGGDTLATGLAVAFDGQDISLLTPEEIKQKAQSVMEYVSKIKIGVGKDIQIYIQKENDNLFIYNDETSPQVITAEFVNNAEQKGKKISAIVASSAFCTDGYSLSTSLLEKIATKINTNKASMRYIPISNQYHNQNGEDKIIGEWVEAGTHQFQNVTLLKANGYYSENAEIDNNLSASITLNIKEVSLKKNDDGAYIKSVIDADLYDISITANPLDKCCNILQASGEKIIEESDDIMINTFSIEIKNSNFINLLNNDMNAQVELNSKMEELTTNILSEQSESILVENNSKTENDTKIIDNQLQKDDILNTENNVLKEQIKQYDETLSQTLNLLEQKAQENAKLTEKNQILETALKNFIK